MSRLTLQTGSATPLQLTLVAGLGGTLIWVLAGQLTVDTPPGPAAAAASSSGSDAAGSARPDSARPHTVRPDSARPDSARPGRRPVTRPLPALSDADFERIVQTNPFVTSRSELLGQAPPLEESPRPKPPAEPEPPAPLPLTRRQQGIDRLSDAPVRLFYSSRRGTAAVLDDRVLRPGDVVEDVGIVTAVTPDGIRVRVRSTESSDGNDENGTDDRSPTNRR